MGRPLNKKFMGDPAAAGRTFPAIVLSKAWLNTQPAVSTNPVYILKQTGTKRYLVTDGTVMGTVQLTAADPTGPGEGNVLVTPYKANAESGAMFTFTYKVLSATVTAGHAGTGYTVGDVLTMSNGTTLTVATITGGGGTGPVATVTVSAAGSRGTVSVASSSGVAPVSGGTGTGAQFDLNFSLNNATVTGGVNYTAGESVTFVGMAAATMPTATITTVNGNGTPAGVNITNPGSGITVSATSATGSNPPPTEHARRIKNRSVHTFEGHVYTWDPFNVASAPGQADLPENKNTGSEKTMYMLGNQAALASTAPGSGGPSYASNINAGPSSSATAVFASGGSPGGMGNQQRPRTVTSPDASHSMGVGRTLSEADAEKQKATRERMAKLNEANKSARLAKKANRTKEENNAWNDDVKSNNDVESSDNKTSDDVKQNNSDVDNQINNESETQTIPVSGTVELKSE